MTSTSLDALLRRMNQMDREIQRLKSLEKGGIWIAWTPTVTYAGGSLDPTSLVVNHARYAPNGKMISFVLDGTLTVGTGNRTFVAFTLPTNYAAIFTFAATITFNGTKVCPAYSQGGPSRIVINVGGMISDGYIWVSGIYEKS